MRQSEHEKPIVLVSALVERLASSRLRGRSYCVVADGSDNFAIACRAMAWKMATNCSTLMATVPAREFGAARRPRKPPMSAAAP